jgi:hypothetical protein
MDQSIHLIQTLDIEEEDLQETSFPTWICIDQITQHFFKVLAVPAVDVLVSMKNIFSSTQDPSP